MCKNLCFPIITVTLLLCFTFLYREATRCGQVVFRGDAAVVLAVERLDLGRGKEGEQPGPHGQDAGRHQEVVPPVDNVPVILGRKLLSCSQVKNWVKELTWLLIGCLKIKDQSEAKLAL